MRRDGGYIHGCAPRAGMVPSYNRRVDILLSLTRRLTVPSIAHHMDLLLSAARNQCSHRSTRPERPAFELFDPTLPPGPSLGTRVGNSGGRFLSGMWTSVSWPRRDRVLSWYRPSGCHLRGSELLRTEVFASPAGENRSEMRQRQFLYCSHC